MKLLIEARSPLSREGGVICIKSPQKFEQCYQLLLLYVRMVALALTFNPVGSKTWMAVRCRHVSLVISFYQCCAKQPETVTNFMETQLILELKQAFIKGEGRTGVFCADPPIAVVLHKQWYKRTWSMTCGGALFKMKQIQASRWYDSYACLCPRDVVYCSAICSIFPILVNCWTAKS